ncbi:multidrug effflux MFS transporter [Desulforhopalus vacuolatus]|uniref:multidrug effflux MFS transporter n=1 Tax=Desulforhopalus vacuolatus TaxID=40414 RepID=UPI0019658FE4|nr:multidrug effflux MFS transporter [Desulforhopalus vacuolatus]MBM9518285.1 multidrug effflux MFS transporter [Desulforhopalus vacuolatus]
MTKTSNRKMLVLLSLLAAFPPLSTDMYLPALPLLSNTWQQPMSVINLTLVGFFTSYCIFILIYGPLSDRFGRRYPLLAGIGLYIVASLFCAGAENIVSLIVFRVLQAAGAASASALSMAITKDLYQGKERQRLLAYMAMIMGLAPMLAPLFGGWIMTWASWPWVFFAQAFIGLVAWGGVFRMAEPLHTKSNDSMIKTIGLYLYLLSNRRYVLLVLLFSCIVLPHFAFIGSAAEIYINNYGTTEQVFGYFFAFNALAIVTGAFVCTWLQKKIEPGVILALSFGGILLGGVIMFAGFFQEPWSLAIPMAIASFSFGLSRPPSNHLILEQVDKGVGTASSFMIFVYFMTGAFAMWLISLGWADKVEVISLLAMTSGGIVLAIWLISPHFMLSDRKGNLE